MTSIFKYDVDDETFQDGVFSNTFEEMIEDVFNAIPRDLAETHYAENIHRVICEELERISAALHVLKRNNFLAIADEDGITFWESVTGLPIDHDISLSNRRKYLQAKNVGRNVFLGYHFHGLLELLGGPVRRYIFEPSEFAVSIRFTDALSERQIDKIRYFCNECGPAHLRWTFDSPGAGDGWVTSQDSEYTAPWLRSSTTPDQESEYLGKRWTELTADQRQRYVDAARADFASMSDDEKMEIYGTLDEPGWMQTDWLTMADGTFDDDDAPPRYDEYI